MRRIESRQKQTL